MGWRSPICECGKARVDGKCPQCDHALGKPAYRRKRATRDQRKRERYYEPMLGTKEVSEGAARAFAKGRLVQ